MDINQFIEEVNRVRAGRGRVQWPKEIRTIAIKFLADGMSMPELSAQTGISITALRNWGLRKSPRKFIEAAVVKIPQEDKQLLFSIEGKDFTINVQNCSEAGLLKLCQEIF